MWRPVTEEELLLYVDGHLSRPRADSVEAYLAANPSEARRIGDYLRLNSLVHALAREIDDGLPPEGEVRLRALVARYAARRQRILRGSALALALLAAAAVGAAGEAIWQSGAVLIAARQHAAAVQHDGRPQPSLISDLR